MVLPSQVRDYSLEAQLESRRRRAVLRRSTILCLPPDARNTSLRYVPHSTLTRNIFVPRLQKIVGCYFHTSLESRHGKSRTQTSNDGTLSHSIVRGYLLHYGYQDTLNAFDGSEGVHSAPGGSQNGNGHLAHKDIGWFALDERKQLRQVSALCKLLGSLIKARF